MKSLVIAGRRLPVDPLLETLGLLLADDYFGVGIMVQAQDEFAAEIVAQIADALHADDVLAVGAEEAGRIELSFEFVHAHGNRLRGAIVEMQAHDFVFGEYVVYLPYRIGALVGPTIEQPFTVVSDNSEMYAYFSISENKLRQFEARYGSIDRIISEMPPISLQLNNGSVYGKQGKIETISGIVNPTTGAVQIKALFPNINRHLLSGTIGNVILQGLNEDAILIPMTATVELQDKIIAYRLKNGKAEAAYLTVDRLNDGNRFVVKQGLSVGDTIITEGVGQIKEGMIVTPKTVTP